ncbi:MAG: hypothetical protein EZS28_040579, partial [Streblomastix strix]
MQFSFGVIYEEY